MKKAIAIALATLAIGAALVGCGKEKTCDGCGETYKGKSYSFNFLGQDMEICETCYNDVMGIE